MPIKRRNARQCDWWWSTLKILLLHSPGKQWQKSWKTTRKAVHPQPAFEPDAIQMSVRCMAGVLIHWSSLEHRVFTFNSTTVKLQYSEHGL
jgi:hypothetical protein